MRISKYRRTTACGMTCNTSSMANWALSSMRLIWSSDKFGMSKTQQKRATRRGIPYPIGASCIWNIFPVKKARESSQNGYCRFLVGTVNVLSDYSLLTSVFVDLDDTAERWNDICHYIDLSFPLSRQTFWLFQFQFPIFSLEFAFLMHVLVNKRLEKAEFKESMSLGNL